MGSQTCKNICQEYKAPKPGRFWYVQGNKYCRVCMVLLRWDGIHCPCCTVMVSVRARNGKFRKEVKRID